MVKTEPGGEGIEKPSLKVKLNGKGVTQKQPANGSAKLKVRLSAAASDPAYSEHEAVDLAESDISDAEEIKPKKQPAKRPKRQAKKAKRARTPDEADEVQQDTSYLGTSDADLEQLATLTSSKDLARWSRGIFLCSTSQEVWRG